MSQLHNELLIMNKTIDVANNIQSISAQEDATRMVNLAKQALQFREKLKQVKEQENTEEKNIDKDGKNEPLVYKSKKNNKNPESGKKYKIDEYRGNILDIRL